MNRQIEMTSCRERSKRYRSSSFKKRERKRIATEGRKLSDRKEGAREGKKGRKSEER